MTPLARRRLSAFTARRRLPPRPPRLGPFLCRLVRYFTPPRTASSLCANARAPKGSQVRLKGIGKDPRGAGARPPPLRMPSSSLLLSFPHALFPLLPRLADKHRFVGNVHVSPAGGRMGVGRTEEGMAKACPEDGTVGRREPLFPPFLSYVLPCLPLLPCASPQNKHRQVGNAVPPPLAAALGRELRKALEKKAEAERQKRLAA